MKSDSSVQDYGQWRGFHPDGRPYSPEDWPLARSLRRGEVVLDESIEFERSDSSRAIIEYSSAPVRDEHSSIIAGVVVLADVSGRVSAERAREAFLAVLSHELRTPITSILLAGRQLRGGYRKLTAGARRGLYVDIEAEAERLNRVVENLLVLSRIERGAEFAPCEPVLLHRLLPAMVSAEQKLWPDVRFHLKCSHGLPVIQGEPGYLEQVVRNLLANAAKYAGGDVDVSLAIQEGELVLQVIDRGPGISAEDRPHVFDLFYRAQGTKSAVGAGIGLFVVRNLVEAMGGRVAVTEWDGGGACFSVALAALPAETA
jgi:signal transduction histidine kinase